MFLTVMVYIFGGLSMLWIGYRIKNRQIFEYVKNCPEVESYPLIGSAHLWVGIKIEDLFNMIIENVRKVLISPVKLWIFNKLIIIVTNPIDVQKILASPYCINKSSNYQMFPVPCGLITSKQKDWQPHRKFLNPVFHITQLKSFFNIFNDISKQLCYDLNQVTNKIDFDISPIIGYRSLDLSLQTSFDAAFSTDTTMKLFVKTKKALEICGEKVLQHYSTLILYKIPQYFLKKLNIRKLPKQKYAHSFMNPVLRNRQLEYYAEVEQNDGRVDTEDELRHNPEILIKKLMKLKELGYMSEAFMKGHIETMMFAGSETLTIAVSNILLMLAMETEVQEKCVLELINFLGEHPDYIDFEQLPKLTYLDRAIKECLRIFPVVPLIGRRCGTDLKLDNCTIPKGTDIFILIMNMHLDDKQWGEDSRKFNVDNFLPENVAKRHPLSYIPFSHGSRNCIGYKYANFAMKIMVAHLLLKFKFITKLKYEDLKFAYGITIILKNKYIVSIENR